MTGVRGLEYTPLQELYFMSDEQKDAVVGRLMREHRENKEQIGRLYAEAQKWGNKLREIGNGLVNNLESGCLQGTGLNVNYARYRVDFNAGDFDVAKLTALTNDYRAALKTRDDLEGQLANVGFPVARDY